jgi:osmoprotectant transport system permease protein
VFDFQSLWMWLVDSENWEGRYGLPNLIAEHLSLTLMSIGIAALIALPIGIAIGHSGKGGSVVVLLGSASRAIPTMGLLFVLVMLLGVQQRELAVTLALVAIAFPPILSGAYAGIRAIEAHISEAARAQGMTSLQLIRLVEIPLATPAIIGGFRIAWIQVVSTVVLAPLIGLGGLGFGIIQGLALRNFDQVVASAMLIVILTVVGDQLIGVAQKAQTLKLENSSGGRNK